MGNNFIGPEELSRIAVQLGILVPTNYPEILFSRRELTRKQDEYILLLGATQMKNGETVTIKSLRTHLGIDPDKSEPCFYNQDWYLKEKFIEKPLEPKWFLVRKDVFQTTRGKNPEEISLQYYFPSAILCTYAFFAYWFHFKKYLWMNDFIWCNDLDGNGDRIYVARYIDPTGLCKNGYSIHRHLKIREFYGCVDFA